MKNPEQWQRGRSTASLFVLGWALILSAYAIYLGLRAFRYGTSGDAANWLAAPYLWLLYFVVFLLIRKWLRFRDKVRRLPHMLSGFLAWTLRRTAGIGLVFLLLSVGFCDFAVSVSLRSPPRMTGWDRILWESLNLVLFVVFYLLTCIPALFFVDSKADFQDA